MAPGKGKRTREHPNSEVMLRQEIPVDWILAIITYDPTTYIAHKLWNRSATMTVQTRTSDVPGSSMGTR